ncbi:hypothetical protein GF324_02670, partial [bacterium]|nr:hypothetical protein [bacterium]
MSFRKYLNLYHAALTRRSRRPSGDPSGRLLVVQVAPLGDACTLVPVCLDLRAAGYTLDVVCRAGLEPLWHEFLPDAHVIGVRDGLWCRRGAESALATVLERAYEGVFVTSMKPYAAYLGALPAAHRRYGMIEERQYYSGARGIFDRLYSAGRTEHVVKRFRGLFRLHADVADKWDDSPRIPETPAESGTDGYVLIHP